MTAADHRRDERAGSARQIASARLFEYADGPERGQRALFLSSGGGLDMFVMVDRSFDIGEVRHQGRQIAWLGPQGLPAPAIIPRDGKSGQGFVRGFGGFLVTCGLTHFGKATESEPQHGRFPYLPSRLLAHGERFDGPDPCVFGEAETVQARYGGEALRLRRRIELPVGGTSMRIRDTIRNIGPDASPIRVMYHFNLGYPLVADRARVVLNGEDVVGPVAFPDPAPDRVARSFACGSGDVATCIFGTGEESIRFRWNSQDLPVLQVWHDLAPGIGVFSIEPRTVLPGEPGPDLQPNEEIETVLDVDFPTPGTDV